MRMMSGAEKKVRALFDNEKGMTLVELLVASMITCIAFLGLAAIFPLGMQNISESRMKTVATDLAQEKMEELMHADITDSDLNAGDHTDPRNPVRTTFNRSWTVLDNEPVADMRRIEVRVTYPHGTDTRDVVLVGYRRSWPAGRAVNPI
jgi:prepilin-type N-terminal cleavage/methylation domain-containing protein